VRAVAVGTTSLIELDGETLEGMFLERPEIAIRMIRRLATRLISAERRLAAVGLDDLVGPLVRWLVSQSDDVLEGELRIATTLRELSENSKLPMQETHQALHQLMDQKLVRLDGDELVAPDRAALTAAAAQPTPAG
jgi:CRP-like cAMP-binding protein